jgi:hypothetical protein
MTKSVSVITAAHRSLAGLFAPARSALLVALAISNIALALNVALAAEDDADNQTPADGSAQSEAVARQAEYFEKFVRPLLAERCYECHDAQSGPNNGGLVLDSVAGIDHGGSRGKIIDAAEPASSLLLKTITYQDADLEMPPDGKMSDAEIAIIDQWLKSGAALPQYKGDAPPVPSSAGIDLEKGRQFWSFQPLSDVGIPDLRRTDWVRQPLDAFVLASLESQGIEPNPPADRATLLRRLSLSVIGLPPTTDQIESFVNDTSDLAYESAVERLLDSPYYGQRWARVWLDLARYTDFTPDWQSPTDRGWLYRDWVVQAFNANMPYDRFIKLQLAADLIPDTPAGDLAALGFLGLSPTYWKELQLAPSVIAQIVADEWDERIDAVSRTFLGLTVSCARCHHHKFDPISADDYYAMAGVFASTQLHEQPLLDAEPAGAVMKAREEIRALEAKIAAIEDKESEEAKNAKQQIETLRTATPHIDTPLAHTLREASVYVVPNGEDATKLEYRENETRDLPIFQRGNPTNPGPIVPRRYLSVFLTETSDERFSSGSGRGELADAMLRHSEGLIARVIVNRIWAQHFGAGLVRTPSDFGSQGDPPTHPELLEYLAFQLVESGWDLKWLHRQILLSATWQQSTNLRDDAYAVDPDNKLLWRMNRRRLEFEQWRDSILFVSGQIDLAMDGPSKAIDDPSNVRRTLYATVEREELHPILRMHDFPEASAHSPNRTPTITPLQQLFVLNSAWMQAQAAAVWDRVSITADQSVDAKIAASYRLIFGREPFEAESKVARDYLDKAEQSSDTERAERWQTFLQALLGLNEFCFMD